jgi:hypothetical protein
VIDLSMPVSAGITVTRGDIYRNRRIDGPITM